MLSMLLGMEDDESSCIYWSPTAICGDHHHTLHFCCLDGRSMSTILSQALVIIVSQLVLTSFCVVLYCCFNFHKFFFNLQNRTCTEPLLHCKVLEIIFPTSGHSPQLDSEQESYTLFTPSMQTVPTDFRTCDAQWFGCNSLHRSPKMLNLDVLERSLNGAPDYPNFSFSYIFKHAPNLD
jgi:hypothetical protein